MSTAARMRALPVFAMAAAAGLAACSSAPPAPVKSAGAPLPTVTNGVPAAVVAAPLTPVITPGETPDMPGLARRLAALIDGAKPQVTTYPIDVTSLPRAAIPTQLDAKAVTKIDVSKLKAETDLVVKPADGYARQYMMSLSFADPAKMTFGRVRAQGSYGQNDGWFGEGYSSVMNVYQTCGRGSGLVPVHWETVLLDKDAATYTVAESVLDRATCSVYRVKSGTVVAKPLLTSGILFGFRSCEDACPDNEALTILFPRASASAAGALGGEADRTTGSFSIVSFPIQRGGGGAFVARVQKRDVARWRLRANATKRDEAAPVVLDDAKRLGAIYLSTFDLGVEVSQARDDEAPIAIAHLDVDLAALPGPTPEKDAGATPIAAPLPGPQGTSSRIGFNSPDPLEDRR